MKNKYIIMALLCAGSIACGTAGEVYNDPDLGPVVAGEEPLELGTLEQPITSLGTIDNGLGQFFGNNKTNSIGVSGLQGTPGKQADVSPGAPANQVYLVPDTVSWSVKITGFAAGAETTRITDQATAAESVLTNTIGVGSSWFHVTGTTHRIALTKLPDDGGPLGDISKFVSVTCNSGASLSEPGNPVPGLFFKVSNANGGCQVGVRLAKVIRLISGVTPQNRVIKHGIDWALAGIAGAGENSVSTQFGSGNDPDNDVTNRKLNLNITKANMHQSQKCLMTTWTNPASNSFQVCNTLGCPAQCQELPPNY